MRRVMLVVVLLSLVLVAQSAQAAVFSGHSVIALGEHGSHVALARCVLERLGFAAKPVRDKEVFDVPMVAAVRRLQLHFGLPNTGNLGPLSLARIEREAWAVEQCVQPDGGREEPAQPAAAGQDAAAPAAARPCAFRRAYVIKAQALLDRRGFSPGEIDGVCGSNLHKALAALRREDGIKGPLSEADLDRLLADSGGPALIAHPLTEKEVAGPFIASVPHDPLEMAKLPFFGYTSVAEKLGEWHHMSPGLLRSLNPDAAFAAGETITVADVGPAVSGDAANRLVLSLGDETLRVLTAAGRTLAQYPVTVNQERTPRGLLSIKGVIKKARYTVNPEMWGLDPRIGKLDVAAGPNNPVGGVWISLSKPSFGIHGTPEPSRIGKNESHGCIRLTNWDAHELKLLVRPGIVLEVMP